MIKKLIVVGLIVVAGVWVFKKTNITSYASTLWSNGAACLKNQVPREFEIDRVRNQISQLDGDVRNLLGPIAEKMAQIKKLDRDIQTARANLKEQRENLLALTQAVESGDKFVVVGGEELKLAHAKTRLEREFTIFKRGEQHLNSQEQLLDAHRKNLSVTHEQLSKMMEQKREFEIRLAQLEVQEEHLKLQRITTPITIDESRIADIKATLDAIEQGQEVDAAKVQLLQQYNGKLSTRPTGTLAATDVAAIRAYLEGQATVSTRSTANSR